ncbi:MAG TPA: bifunctional metallophosphatase/5'-nucleotidase, partial [Flavisolibacter sp.]|nr:bifunctional metallophosphatase/5'-nucleotidase [Flavisolibacter sp.]
TLKKEWLQKNPNTFLVIAGDFVSPSVYNSLQYHGKAVRGRQMVESLNAAGMDFAVFGNHEFDIKENELQERINESAFQWISTNAFHRQNGKVMPFEKDGAPFPKTYVLKLSDADGTTAKIGIITATLPFNRADYVSYTDALISAKEAYNNLKDSVDAVIALTHQTVAEDKKLAAELPGLAVVLGGHEHDMRFERVGDVYITKAHANAKSAYAVNLHINKRKKKTETKPQLVYINESIALDSATNVVVKKWTDIAERNYSSLGFEARKTVLNNGTPLDGREAEVRSHPTNLTRLVIFAMQEAAPQADVVLMNSGSIRVDDVLPMPITEYDIIRTLPFGGGIREADMKGSLLIRTLEQGLKNRGIGGYLQYNESIINEDGTWKLKGSAIEPDKIYRVAMSDFLFTGKEANLDFLNPSNADVVKVYEPVTSIADSRSDIRLAVVRYLEKRL